MCKHPSLISIVTSFVVLIFASKANAQFPWPVTPFDVSQEITGTFCEFRDTGSAYHFHNGTDIPKPDGSAVYPVQSGIVTSLTRSGSNAFVRVQDKAYVHIRPAPSLGVGDSVLVSQSVLGTILPGAGHVHFTNGFVGSERNSMLSADGLSPFMDTWPPLIRYIRFYQDRSTQEFKNGKVAGPVDIIVKVDEQNGPPSSRISRRNNGIYRIGYKVFSSDTTSVVYEPPNEGVRFQFDTKPSNAFVHNVFSDQMSSTTRHVYVVTNNTTSNGLWDTGSLPVGRYVVMAFAEDTRSNADTLYSAVEVTDSDVLPPEQPVIKFVRSQDNALQVAWFPNTDSELAGYRLSFSYDNVSWSVRLDESKLTAINTDTTFDVSLNRDIYFRLTAVDNSVFQNQSIQTDVYGSSNVNPDHRILVVDGFDRSEASGSWHEPWHDFALYYGRAIAANGFGFDTAANDAILDGSILLSEYDAVMWFLGDESTEDETFKEIEQVLIKDYLQNGGMLFVTGSEIAWDLDQDNDSGSSESDEDFLHEYLRVDYAGNDANTLAVDGVAGTIFERLSLQFGANPYEEDSPDYVISFGNATIANLLYGSTLAAGVQYEGTFVEGSVPGKLVYFGFPFETIQDEEIRNTVMGRILRFFFPTIFVGADTESGPMEFTLLQNFPNPFNPQTVIPYALPVVSHVDVTVYDAMGLKVRRLVHQRRSAGAFEEIWDGLDNRGSPVASGNYFVRLEARSLDLDSPTRYEKTIAITLVR